MSATTDTSLQPRFQKRFLIPIACLALICVLFIAYSLCAGQYSIKKKEMLSAQENALNVWIQGTVEAVSLWSSALETQAKRLSSSDMYRLFATEISQLDAKTAATISEADTSTLGLSEDASMLVEQVPLMRNVMLDFMNYNGLLDIRIANSTGQTLVSALARPTPLTDAQLNLLQLSLKKQKLVFAPIRTSPSGLCLDYADPVFSISDNDVNTRAVASVLITTPITGQIAQFLARSFHKGDSPQPYIVQKTGDGFECLVLHSPSPLPLDTKTFVPNASGNLSFGLRHSLSSDQQVYSVGVKVPELNWWVVLEIPAVDVQKKLDSEALQIYGLGFLATIGFILFLALLWWVIIGRQQRAIAERFQNLYTVIQRQKCLLDSINTSIGTGLLMSTTTGDVLACNPAFAEIVHSTEDNVVGSALCTLFEPAFAIHLLQQIQNVADSNTTAFFEKAITASQDERLFRVTLYPFSDSTENQQDKNSGAVALFQDITEFRRNSEKRRQQQASTINALVQAVEGVDPYLAGHSHMMGNLVTLMGKQLGLPELDVNTLRTAANLSQIGRLFVPRELFSKTDKLTTADQEELMRVPEHAFNVLRNIDFGMPVPQAIYQMHEYM
ncbi:MAG: PAS domain-containing protein, partial [Desulfovibrionaceae bacterium]